MSHACVDSSCLVGLALGERGANRLRKRLLGFDRLRSSNLAEAEVPAALRREEVSGGKDLLTWIDRVKPSRPLTPKIHSVLEAG